MGNSFQGWLLQGKYSPLPPKKTPSTTISGGLGRVKATIQRAVVVWRVLPWLLHSQEKLSSTDSITIIEYLQQDREIVFVRSFRGEERDFGLTAQLQKVPSVDRWDVFGLLREFLGSWENKSCLKVGRQGTGMSPCPPHPTKLPWSQHSPWLHLSRSAQDERQASKFNEGCTANKVRGILICWELRS